MIMCIQNLVLFCQFVLKILSKNRILTSIKSSNSVANLRKTTIYDTNVDLVNDNVYTKFGLNRSICFQDIEQKLNSDVNKKLAASKAYSIPPAICRSKPCKFVSTVNHYSICALDENWPSSKCCIFVKKLIFGIKLLHAHLQYVCNIPGKYQMNILKAEGPVDFTKYALLPISQYVQWSKIG